MPQGIAGNGSILSYDTCTKYEMVEGYVKVDLDYLKTYYKFKETIKEKNFKEYCAEKGERMESQKCTIKTRESREIKEKRNKMQQVE